MSQANDSPTEHCARCADDLEGDGRTLWHACFYAMDELPIPFEQQTLFVADLADLELSTPAKTIPSAHGPIVVGAAKARCRGELSARTLFTLKVCKACRSEWLAAIDAWFKAPRARESCGSGIFVREGGASVEITREEWDRRNPGREPVVVLADLDDEEG